MKRHALISDIEMGGLKMLDIDSMISAKRNVMFKTQHSKTVMYCNTVYYSVL